MKLIIAIIQPDKFHDVHKALIDNEVFRITVGRVTGHGRQQNVDLYRGQEVTPNLIPKVRIEVAVNEEFVQPAIDAILKGARSEGAGKIGDGKIFVLPLENCIRIRTGNEGREAI